MLVSVVDRLAVDRQVDLFEKAVDKVVELRRIETLLGMVVELDPICFEIQVLAETKFVESLVEKPVVVDFVEVEAGERPQVGAEELVVSVGNEFAVPVAAVVERVDMQLGFQHQILAGEDFVVGSFSTVVVKELPGVVLGFVAGLQADWMEKVGESVVDWVVLRLVVEWLFVIPTVKISSEET